MAECSESDGELFITQSKYSSREVGSDTDNVLSGILDLEECIQRDVSEDPFFGGKKRATAAKIPSALGRKRLGKYGGEYKIKEYGKQNEMGGKSFLKVAKSEKRI